MNGLGLPRSFTTVLPKVTCAAHFQQLHNQQSKLNVFSHTIVVAARAEGDVGASTRP